MSTLLDLSLGEAALIVGFQEVTLEMRLLELGCLPGTMVQLDRITPWGGPLIFTVNQDYQLALRKQEAELILVSPLVAHDIPSNT